MAVTSMLARHTVKAKNGLGLGSKSAVDDAIHVDIPTYCTPLLFGLLFMPELDDRVLPGCQWMLRARQARRSGEALLAFG